MRNPRHYRIVALPGEGIGPEVVEACLTILEAIALTEGFTITVERALIGGPARKQFGSPLPAETLRLCERSDGILFGAVTQGGLLELRRHFDLFTNLRPVRPSPSLINASPIKAERLADVDLLFVRELVSGIYFGLSGRKTDENGPYGFHTMRYADQEIRRVAKVALGYASRRRSHLVVAHKENALPHLPWSRLVAEEAIAFPTVKVEPMLVDNLAMQLVIRPRDFDVVLAGNLFGDILSDLGGAIAGSIGLLGSASLNAEGFGLYEAVHGTAPDIAGKGIANPLGTLAGVILMLEQWGEQKAADRLANIQASILAQGYRTFDLTSNLTSDITLQSASASETVLTTAALTDLFLMHIREP
ncbi:3-isopropylmalate dehydrogenase [cf. Phormidesmis sp. LEGE 11477]|nr:3-isopropylmalate dehydrogenase [cf. Phormidesmis sp. LEGE 11477]